MSAPELSPDELLTVIEFGIHDGDQPEVGHSCGRCRTPYGLSTIPCVNDPANRPGWREVAPGREKTTNPDADTETRTKRVTEAHRGNR